MNVKLVAANGRIVLTATDMEVGIRLDVEEGIEVEGASMDNGLLSVDLSQPINSEESKKIEIKDSSKKNDKLISLDNGKSRQQK